MEKGKKTGLLVILIIVIVVVTIIISINVKTNKKEEGQATNNTTTNTEEYVQVVNNDIKLNVSNKLQEAKKIDGIEISNIQLTEQGGMTTLLADAKNTTSAAAGDFPVKINLLDKNGNTVVTLNAYIQKLTAGQSAQFSASITFDYANVYDFTVEK